MSLWSSNHSVPQTPDMTSSVPVVGKGRKRKRDDGSNDAVLKHSDCESDSDSDFACEAPDGGDGLSTATGKRLQSGIRTFTYLKSSSEINLSSTKEPSTDRVTQNTLGTNNTSLCSNSVPEVSVDESVSDSEGEEAAQVEEVEPTISCVKATLSSELHGSMSSTRRVWLMGDSCIYWLKKYTQELYESPNLGILQTEITWFGKRDMKWNGVLEKLVPLAEGTHPDILILHCGGNDLGAVRGVSLITAMKADLEKVMQMFPKTKIVYSHICQRRVWQFGKIEGSKLEKCRRLVNKVVSAYLRDYKMYNIPHHNIIFHDETLYLADGVNLTNRGNEIFLSGLRAFLTDQLCS